MSDEKVAMARVTSRRLYRRTVPRAPRLQVAGATYHVTARGNADAFVFLNDVDRQIFLTNLTAVVLSRGWSCRAYCLMTTHYHLLITTKEADLARGMQRMNGRYAQWFNARHSRSGHVFQGRYHSVLIESQGHLLEVYRYIALNPVRAGLCERPEEWLWGSYRLAVGEGRAAFPASDWLLEHFGGGRRGLNALRTFVQDGQALLGHGRGQTP